MTTFQEMAGECDMEQQKAYLVISELWVEIFYPAHFKEKELHIPLWSIISSHLERAVAYWEYLLEAKQRIVSGALYTVGVLQWLSSVGVEYLTGPLSALAEYSL